LDFVYVSEQERGEVEGERKRREEGEEGLTGGSHRHVASNSAKLPSKTARWPNMNGFESWMAADVRF